MLVPPGDPAGQTLPVEGPGCLEGLPVDVVREMLESIVAEDMSVLEDTILNVGGYRQKVAVLRQEEMLTRQGQGFGTATVTRQPTKPLPYICPNPESSCILPSPAADDSSWELVEGVWTNKSGSDAKAQDASEPDPTLGGNPTRLKN